MSAFEAHVASCKIRNCIAQICICVLTLLIFTATLAAQTPPQSSSALLGEVIGDDISVVGQSSVLERQGLESITFANGSIIIVHSGKARVEFSGGGEIDVCGPAKFTVLASGEALTIALSFGRVHLRFNPLRPVIVYTPLILATPISVSEQPRDLTLGLTDSGAMCFYAAHGAFRLQYQLTGESIIVPQPSEILLQGSSFASLHAATGQCRCSFNEPIAKTRAPWSSLNTPTLPQRTPVNAPPISPRPSVESSAAAASPLASRPTRRPSPKNQHETPVMRGTFAPSAPQQPVPPEQATAVRTVPRVTLPPIGYDVKGPAGASEPLSVATLMLAKEAVIQPRWIFHGLIIAPVKKIQSAGIHKSQANVTAPDAPHPQKPSKLGFWAKLVDFFIVRRAPCEGVGCS